MLLPLTPPLHHLSTGQPAQAGSSRFRLVEELVPFMDHNPEHPQAQRLGAAQHKRKFMQASAARPKARQLTPLLAVPSMLVEKPL